LNSVSFSIEPNEQICIVSDTSLTVNSLFYLLTGICNKQSGTIAMDNIPLENLNIQELRSQIGTVLVSDQLIDVSIEDNIRFGNQSIELSEISALMEELGMTNFVDQCIEKYTTQLNNEIHFIPKDAIIKLLYARAIIKKPRLLLLDEPTVGMTTGQKQPLLSHIEQLKNTTVLIASNDQDIHKMVDRIVKFEQGKLVFSGNYEAFSKL
jgi:ATP-binding cassette subfamily B protein